MRKNIINILVLISFLIPSNFAHAAITPTSSPSVTDAPKTPTSEALNNQINQLKERIASRVAQLKLVERRGMIGTVTEVTDTQITVNDVLGNTRFADVDELTKFSSPKTSGSFGISDIAKGSKIGILGLYNKQSRRILARFVDVMNPSKTVSGIVFGINSDNYNFTVVSEDGKQTEVEVETVTKTSSYTKGAGLSKSGFSKIKEGERIFVVGFSDTKDKNKFIASRIIIFPDLPNNPKIKIPKKLINPEDTITPLTGSGKKLTPIK